MKEDLAAKDAIEPVGLVAGVHLEPGPVQAGGGRSVEVHGVVLIADLVDFSTRKTVDQERLVRKLWAALDGHPLCTDSHSGLLVNSTGDGALLAWPAETDCERVLELAEHLVEVMRTAQDSQDVTSGLRVGIHHGRFAVMEVTKLLRLPRQVIGTAPNECARIASLGDPSDIVITQQFYEYFENKADKPISERFLPRTPKEPIKLSVKHGVTLDVRVYLGRFRSKDAPPPKRIAFLEGIDNSIMGALEALHDMIPTCSDSPVSRDVSLRNMRSRRGSASGLPAQRRGSSGLKPPDTGFTRRVRPVCRERLAGHWAKDHSGSPLRPVKFRSFPGSPITRAPTPTRQDTSTRSSALDFSMPRKLSPISSVIPGQFLRFPLAFQIQKDRKVLSALTLRIPSGRALARS